jgi:hypothetical protein
MQQRKITSFYEISSRIFLVFGGHYLRGYSSPYYPTTTTDSERHVVPHGEQGLWQSLSACKDVAFQPCHFSLAFCTHRLILLGDLAILKG